MSGREGCGSRVQGGLGFLSPRNCCCHNSVRDAWPHVQLESEGKRRRTGSLERVGGQVLMMSHAAETSS